MRVNDMAKKKKEKFESIRTSHVDGDDLVMDSLFAKIKLSEKKEKENVEKEKQA
ncbi:conserved protein of unknown function [Oenococcus oeni]|uniref:Uncharacterized protein n=2 Tax=Oenococcus oeni TaxID=1247 RepID=A0NHU0_OENOE|nr:hypothetical protein OENOO_37017 [Oenococcus oeni ATCC BAA-1163]EJO03247.1 hypothetical protein AWRIB418_69 [Oenococcus oeni AWRIB418]SYV98742.1 conserved hypothetical protein [Oenococcus oeni]SYW01608.1 conserved hypothetical protein [Oenococcus oeni]SYW02052.1 conserved hypothetical protein [Oenococcus oeni]